MSVAVRIAVNWKTGVPGAVCLYRTLIERRYCNCLEWRADAPAQLGCPTVYTAPSHDAIRNACLMITNPKRESANVKQHSPAEDEPPDILKPETAQAGMPGTGPVTASAGGSTWLPDPVRSRRFSGLESTPGNGIFSRAGVR